ncbi:MAG: histidine triad nucleotide-binding protein [Chloroflexota bacterium]
MANPDCLFCRIAAGEIPATIVHQDDLVVAFRDISPQAPTHILLIPRRHLASVGDVADGDGELLARLMTTATRLATDAGLDRSGYRLVTNTGPDAGQSVAHLHWHLLGGRPMAWPPG